jgi:hypothetical protein
MRSLPRDRRSGAHLHGTITLAFEGGVPAVVADR